jgi:integrase/recombinase XerC
VSQPVSSPPRSALAGSSGLSLVAGVVHLDPQPAMFDAMVGGWTAQMTSRGLKASSIVSRRWIVKRFAVFTNEYPWDWSPADLEGFVSFLRSRQPRPLEWSTIRGYENQLGGFMTFLTDARYGWAAECEARFGTHPVQICHGSNTLRHCDEFEGRPGRRPLTLAELQDLFDYADGQVKAVAASGRKGTLAAFRDAALWKTVFAWGLRRAEASMLDVGDCHRHPGAERFGMYGSLHVRWGKAVRGGQPRRRSVLSLMDWAVEALEEYVVEVRPRFDPGEHPALWVTERRSRMSPRAIDERFAVCRQAVGLPDEIDLHCLRHSYVTHLVESGYPERFVSEQVGHRASATTAIYTSVSDDFKNQVLGRALAGAFAIGGAR